MWFGGDNATNNGRLFHNVTKAICIDSVHTNDPHTQYLRIRDLIENFEFPSLSYRLPFTVLRRVVSQCLFSSIRPRLSFQPISRKDAKSLDLLIAKKIHEYLAFPFAFNSTLLSLPLSLHGFDFPSISRTNDACALQGLQRDLNHHVPSFRMMADITLADWTCSFNHCCSPFDSSSALGNSRPSFIRRRNLLPWAWVLAHTVMSELNVSLRHTDQSHLFLGAVAISHISRTLSSQRSLSAHIMNSLSRLNILSLSQIATWTYTTHPITQLHPSWALSPRDDVFAFLSKNIPPHQITALSTWLRNLSLSHITYGLDSSLAIPRHLRQHEAEHHILSLIQASPLPSFISPTVPILASDASMIPPSVSLHQSRSVTLAVSSTFGSITASLQSLRRSASILHGEVYGLITAVVLLRSQASRCLPHSLPPIITDHLNSTRLISDSFIQNHPPLSWSGLPARSLYRWLRDLISQFPTRPTLNYTPAHTSSTSLPSLANAHADHYASSSQRFPLSNPTMPIPTFSMDRYTPFTEEDGFIEYNLASFVHHFSARASASNPAFHPNQTHLRLLYDDHSLPDHPYTRTSSAYSAVVQLYSRSSQLPTPALLSARLRDGAENCRRSQCYLDRRTWVLDNQHHIFVTCPSFQHLRQQYLQRVLEETTKLLEEFQLLPTTHSDLLRAASTLFTDDAQTWPEYRSRYYLGVIPSVAHLSPNGVHPTTKEMKRFTHRVAHLWHTVAIQLSGRIWGEWSRQNRASLEQVILYI